MNRDFKRDGQPEADFFRISAWEKLGENCQKYLEKGRKVAVTGEVSCRAYEGKDGAPKAAMEVRAAKVEFLSAKPSVESAQPTVDSMPDVPAEDTPF